MIRWSVALAVLGVGATAALVAHLSRRAPPWSPEGCWFLGLAGLLPAWLLAFLGLLGAEPLEGKPDLSRSLSWILSSSAALLGLILSDAVARHLRRSGRDHRPLTYWVVGLLTLLPAWAIALIGLALNATRR